MPKKKQAVWLQIYVDGNGKPTFQSFRVEPVEKEGKDGKKVIQHRIVDNEKAKDKYGGNYLKPMNRRARLADAAVLRAYERQYGPKKLAAVEEPAKDAPFELVEKNNDSQT